tara:strand:- start:150 stop:431 length:282 start_codon:yes stop_codon:yes gene_type:complete
MGRPYIRKTFGEEQICCRLCNYSTPYSPNPFLFIKMHYKKNHSEIPLTKSDYGRDIKKINSVVDIGINIETNTSYLLKTDDGVKTLLLTKTNK